jgi:hypothetical protein
LYWRTLMKEMGFPFIKTRLLRNTPDSVQDLGNWPETIAQGTCKTVTCRYRPLVAMAMLAQPLIQLWTSGLGAVYFIKEQTLCPATFSASV